MRSMTASKRRGNLWANRSDGNRMVGLMRQQFLRDRLGVVKRRSPREQIVTGRTEAIYVGSNIDFGGPQRLFGRQIVRSAENCFFVESLRNRIVIIEMKSCQPKIENLERPLTIEQQVARRQIAVNESGLMNMVKPLGSLCQVLCRCVDWQWAPLTDHVEKIDALDVIHHQVVEVFSVRVDVMRLNDVGMIERAAGPRFAWKRACCDERSFGLIGNTLTATRCFIEMCSARKTFPMPPDPRGSRMRYLPSVKLR